MSEGAATSLGDFCRQHGPALDPAFSAHAVRHNGQPVDGSRLLWALAGCESSFGLDREHARFEPAYAPKGRYYFAAEHVRHAYRRYGALAACSYGTWQILYIVAFELGFAGHPIDLQQDLVSVEYVIRLIVGRFVPRGATSLDRLLDAYNSGDHRDTLRPTGYIEKGIRLYEAGLTE